MLHDLEAAAGHHIWLALRRKTTGVTNASSCTKALQRFRHKNCLQIEQDLDAKSESYLVVLLLEC